MEQPQYNMFEREKVEREFAAALRKSRAWHNSLVAARLRSAYREIQRR